jgi:ribose-phosphate pyrophosphokinase
VYVCSVHGILSGPAIERLRATPIRELVLTDTAPLPEEKRLPNMTILSVAELFAGAITRIHEGRSVAELFR